ncbi:methyltransferase, type 11 [Desulfobacula toluolica Tol2]|uniref:Methyltransferase, type 11 n=2 Tax=Desulfobacula toluolica TaxID=28223 RepID=K0NJA4_DESTT|nr:methyltransferase, type 11 [Desulfobacula toluolica Tol2]
MNKNRMNHEVKRIQRVYAERDASGRKALYEWHRPEIIQQDAARRRIAATLLANTIGRDISKVRVLDVGCGSGTFLRTLVEWGAYPENLVGTELLTDRLKKAQQCSAPGIDWHIGELDFAESDRFDLVVTNTVFSSILDKAIRTQLATDMWRVLKPGGWIMVFDFRYNNPSNRKVRKVTRQELRGYWPAIDERYQTLLLAPPIARRLASAPYLISELLTGFIPLLRSHFIYMAQKGQN